MPLDCKSVWLPLALAGGSQPRKFTVLHPIWILWSCPSLIITSPLRWDAPSTVCQVSVCFLLQTSSTLLHFLLMSVDFGSLRSILLVIFCSFVNNCVCLLLLHCVSKRCHGCLAPSKDGKVAVRKRRANMGAGLRCALSHFAFRHFPKSTCRTCRSAIYKLQGAASFCPSGPSPFSRNFLHVAS